LGRRHPLLQLSLRRPPRPPLLPYTTLFRSHTEQRCCIRQEQGDENQKADWENNFFQLADMSQLSHHDSTIRFRGQRPHNRRLDKDRKSTRLNSSHVKISYAVFCLKKNNP